MCIRDSLGRRHRREAAERGPEVGAPSAPEYVLGDICAAARRFKATGDATSALAGGDLASCTLG